jgi:hypothetical protein
MKFDFSIQINCVNCRETVLPANMSEALLRSTEVVAECCWPFGKISLMKFNSPIKIYYLVNV